jgi:predicted ATPase
MLTKLRLKNFKNFKDAELHLGGFTVLLGTNAAGKSNIRDAIRFLHGIGRGYTLAEIIGGKFIEGGILQWSGIRGGLNEIAFRKSHEFELEVSFLYLDCGDLGKINKKQAHYRILVGIDPILGAVWKEESLFCEGAAKPIFEAKAVPEARNGRSEVYLYDDQTGLPSVFSLMTDRSVLSQALDPQRNWAISSSLPILMAICAHTLAAIRFPDLQAEAMRQTSIPGQTVLSDRGENLSSVVQSISKKPQLEASFLSWLQALTPMDAQKLEFTPDVTGKVLLQLREADGHRTSVISASDGTLKFLGFLAAFLTPDPTGLIFLEEFENGIHPTRLHLLLQLIEQQTAIGEVQTIATTHSPQLLRLLSEDSLKNASLIYRLDDRPDAQIERLVDIPHFQDVLDGSDLGELLESGWLETTMSFQRDEVAIG